jgi:hypothetical protein
MVFDGSGEMIQPGMLFVQRHLSRLLYYFSSLGFKLRIACGLIVVVMNILCQVISPVSFSVHDRND